MGDPLVYGGRGAAPRTVVLFGNCQVPVLAERLSLLSDLNDDYRFVVVNRAADLADIEPAIVPEAYMQDAVLLLEQYENPDVPNAGRISLHQRLPPGCPVITFPSFLMNSMWPFECPDPRYRGEPRFPYGRYQGDFLAMKVAQTGARGAQAVAEYLELSTRKMPDLQVRLQRDLHRMRNFDANCDVRLAGFVEKRFREEYMFGTAGHVDAGAVTELVLRVTDAARPLLGGAAAHVEACMAGLDGMPLQAPIHPVVAEQLGLTFWSADLVYRWYSQAWTFGEYMAHYIDNDTGW